jgi:hypothetical protein
MAFNKDGSQTATEVADAAIEKAAGRKARGGQELVYKPKVLVDAIPELVKRYEASQKAASKLNDLVKSTAEEAGMQATNVTKILKAYVNPDSWQDKKRDANQLSIAFEKVPAPDED